MVSRHNLQELKAISCLAAGVAKEPFAPAAALFHAAASAGAFFLRTAQHNAGLLNKGRLDQHFHCRDYEHTCGRRQSRRRQR